MSILREWQHANQLCVREKQAYGDLGKNPYILKQKSQDFKENTNPEIQKEMNSVNIPYIGDNIFKVHPCIAYNVS